MTLKLSVGLVKDLKVGVGVWISGVKSRVSGSGFWIVDVGGSEDGVIEGEVDVVAG